MLTLPASSRKSWSKTANRSSLANRCLSSANEWLQGQQLTDTQAAPPILLIRFLPYNDESSFHYV